MTIKVLASGSKGNCTIIISKESKIIIDMGITYLTLKKSLEEINYDLSAFTAILITHCHKDHTSGLASLIKKTTLPVYIPEAMYHELKELVPKERCLFISDNFTINDLTIELIHTSHDAACSVGYIINDPKTSLVYVTDTGYINRKFLARMTSKDIYIIESNHDEAMLMDGPYPRFLKERVISDTGHLSNSTTAKYLQKIIGSNTKYIVLAHLSKNNNTPELALTTVKDTLNNPKIKILVASQEDGTPIIEV